MNPKALLLAFLIPSFLLPKETIADAVSISEEGINSVATNLTGDGIAVGVIDQVRPAKVGFDAPGLTNDDIDPTALFFRTGAATPNFNNGDHANGVTGVIVSTGVGTKGVATDAQVYASGFDNGNLSILGFYDQAALATQHVSTQNVNAVDSEGDVRPLTTATVFDRH